MGRTTPTPPWLHTVVILIILSAWAANMTVKVLVPEYEPPPGIDALMLAVVGFLFAGRRADTPPPPPRGPQLDEREPEAEEKG